jgi:hypothetical protein
MPDGNCVRRRLACRVAASSSYPARRCFPRSVDRSPGFCVSVRARVQVGGELVRLVQKS